MQKIISTKKQLLITRLNIIIGFLSQHVKGTLKCLSVSNSSVFKSKNCNCSRLKELQSILLFGLRHKIMKRSNKNLMLATDFNFANEIMFHLTQDICYQRNIVNNETSWSLNTLF